MNYLKKVKLSHYRPTGHRMFWEVKALRFGDIGTNVVGG
jgi:hypothetical protein